MIERFLLKRDNNFLFPSRYLITKGTYSKKFCLNRKLNNYNILQRGLTHELHRGYPFMPLYWQKWEVLQFLIQWPWKSHIYYVLRFLWFPRRGSVKPLSEWLILYSLLQVNMLSCLIPSWGVVKSLLVLLFGEDLINYCYCLCCLLSRAVLYTCRWRSIRVSLFDFKIFFVILSAIEYRF